MKREDAKKALQNFLFEKVMGHFMDVGGEFGESLYDHDAKDLAEKLLEELETLGMKPPRLSEDKCQAIMSVYYGGYTFNQWDDEFEKDEKVVEALNRRLARKNK